MKFPEVPAFLRFARFHDIRSLRGLFHFDQNEYVQVRRHEEGFIHVHTVGSSANQMTRELQDSGIIGPDQVVAKWISGLVLPMHQGDSIGRVVKVMNKGVLKAKQQVEDVTSEASRRLRRRGRDGGGSHIISW